MGRVVPEMLSLDPRAKQHQAEVWKRRWRFVAAREIEELRNTPVEVKLAQLSALMASVDALGMR